MDGRARLGAGEANTARHRRMRCSPNWDDFAEHPFSQSVPLSVRDFSPVQLVCHSTSVRWWEKRLTSETQGLAQGGLQKLLQSHLNRIAARCGEQRPSIRMS